MRDDASVYTLVAKTSAATNGTEYSGLTEDAHTPLVDPRAAGPRGFMSRSPGGTLSPAGSWQQVPLPPEQPSPLGPHPVMISR